MLLLTCKIGMHNFVGLRSTNKQSRRRTFSTVSVEDNSCSIRVQRGGEKV